MLLSWVQMLPLVLFANCCHAQPELFTTLIRMPSIKSQSLRVPSVEQEYACKKQEHIWHYFSKLILLAAHCIWLKGCDLELIKKNSFCTGHVSTMKCFCTRMWRLYLQVVTGVEANTGHQVCVSPEVVNALLGGGAEHFYTFSRGTQQEPASTQHAHNQVSYFRWHTTKCDFQKKYKNVKQALQRRRKHREGPGIGVWC